jgi:hypothetical protein
MRLRSARQVWFATHCAPCPTLSKHSLLNCVADWETGVRVPLVISAPWLPQSIGLRSASIVELVDIMPTTIDLAGLSPPEGETLDGTSLGVLLRKPLPPTESWNKVALSQYPRCPASKDGEMWTTNTSLMWINNWCEFTDRVDIPWMGFSMRTTEYRALRPKLPYSSHIIGP